MLRLSCTVSGSNVALPPASAVLMSKSNPSISNQPAWCSSVEPPLSPSISRKYFVADPAAGAVPTLGLGSPVGSITVSVDRSNPKLLAVASEPSGCCVLVISPTFW